MIEANLALGRLSIRQSRLGGKGASIDAVQYDLVLAAISWESRCSYAMKALGARFKNLNLMRFETTSQETDSRKSRFQRQFEEIAEHLTDINLGRSIAYAENVKILDELFARRALEAQRPLRVLCDITCIPKSYILAILGMGFEKGYFARLDSIYSEGDYTVVQLPSERPKPSGAEQGPISEGKWDTLSVPFFEANTPLAKSRDLLVTLGGELGLTVPFVEKYEPVRLGLIGLRGGSIGDAENLRVILAEPNVSQVGIDVCDAVGVAEYADEFCRQTREEVVTALAVGSKPHALGLGVAGLGRSEMEIVCRVPKRYTILDVPPSHTVMAYTIEDRFEPHAYFS